MELGETVPQALTREILEETGFTIEVGELVGVWSFFNDSKKISGVAVVYETRVTGGELQIASDSTDAHWVSLEEAQEHEIAFETHRVALARWARIEQ